MTATILLDLDTYPGNGAGERILACSWMAASANPADDLLTRTLLRPWTNPAGISIDLYRRRNGVVSAIMPALFAVAESAELQRLLEQAWTRFLALTGDFVPSSDLRGGEAETIDGPNHVFWPEVQAQISRLPGLWPQQAGLVRLYAVDDHQADDLYLAIPRLLIDGVLFQFDAPDADPALPAHPVDEVFGQAGPGTSALEFSAALDRDLTLRSGISASDQDQSDPNSLLDFGTMLVRTRGESHSHDWVSSWPQQLAEAIDPVRLAAVGSAVPAALGNLLRRVYHGGEERRDLHDEDHYGVLMDLGASLELVAALRDEAAVTSNDAEIAKVFARDGKLPESFEDWVLLTQDRAVLDLAGLRWQRQIETSATLSAALKLAYRRELESCLDAALNRDKEVSVPVAGRWRRSWLGTAVWPQFVPLLEQGDAADDALNRYANALLGLAPWLAAQSGVAEVSIIEQFRQFIAAHCDASLRGERWQSARTTPRLLSDVLSIAVDQPSSNAMATAKDWLRCISGLAVLVRQGAGADYANSWYCANLVRAQLGDAAHGIAADVLAPLPLGYIGGQRRMLIEYAGRSLVAADADVLADMGDQSGASLDDVLGLKLSLSAVLSGGQAALLPDLKDGQRYQTVVSFLGSGQVLPPILRNPGNPAEFSLAAWTQGNSALQPPEPEYLQVHHVLRRAPIGAPTLQSAGRERGLHDGQRSGVAALAPEWLNASAQRQAEPAERERLLALARQPLALLCPDEKNWSGPISARFLLAPPTVDRQVWERHWSMSWHQADANNKPELRRKLIAGLQAYVDSLGDSGQASARGFDDPACSAYWVRMSPIFDPSRVAVMQTLMLPLAPSTAGAGAMREWEQLEIAVGAGDASLRIDSLPAARRCLVVNVPAGSAWHLAISALAPASWFDGPQQRFASLLGGEPVAGDKVAFAPLDLLLEVASAELPDAARSLQALQAEVDGEHLRIGLRPAQPDLPSAWAYAHEIVTSTQRWSWRGRTLINEGHSAAQTLADELAPAPQGALIPASWQALDEPRKQAFRRFEQLAFLGRRDSDCRVDHALLAAGATGVQLASFDLPSDPVANLLRLRVQVHSRYRAMQRQPSMLQVPASPEWLPLIVRQRRTTLARPQIDAGLPLTRAFVPEGHPPQLAFLVEFAESWHREGGFAEDVEIEIVSTQHYADPATATATPEIGYVPTRSAAVYRGLAQAVPRGLLGFTRDPANVEAAGFRRASVLVSIEGPELNQTCREGGLMLKLRARRRLHALYTTTGEELRSDWSESFWLEIPPISSQVRVKSVLTNPDTLHLRRVTGGVEFRDAADKAVTVAPCFSGALPAAGSKPTTLTLMLISELITDASGASGFERVIGALPFDAELPTHALPPGAENATRLRARLLSLEVNPSTETLTLDQLFQDRQSATADQRYPSKGAFQDAKARLVAMSDPIDAPPTQDR
jgi:hypothetical protein